MSHLQNLNQTGQSSRRMLLIEFCCVTEIQILKTVEPPINIFYRIQNKSQIKAKIGKIGLKISLKILRNRGFQNKF